MSGDLINAVELYKVIDGKMYLNVNALLDPENFPVIFATTSKVTVVDANAGDKKSHTFTNGTKQILIRSEKVAQIKYNFDEAAFDSGLKATITSGGYLKLDGLYLQDVSIYFETDENNVKIEIIELY